MNRTFTLNFGLTSLALLTSALQRPFLPGLPDPFLGLLDDEIEKKWEDAAQEIAAKGYWEVQSDGTLAIDAAVYAMVDTAASARWTLIASRTHAPQSDSLRLVHLSESLIVEQESLPDDQVALTAVQDIETLIERLKSFWALPEAAAGPGQAFVLHEDQMTEAQRLAVTEGFAACVAFLKTQEIPAKVVNALAETLAGDWNSGTITVLERGENEMRYGETLGWLIGSQGAWQIKPSSQPDSSIRFVPASTEEIWQQINNLIVTTKEKAEKEEKTEI